MLGLQKLYTGFADKKFFFFFALLYLVIFFAFFPPIWSSIDEHGYVKRALLLTQGEIGVSEPEYACRASYFNGEEYVSNRFIGKSVFLVPFIPLGISGVMVSGLIIHLINFFIFFIILKRLGIRKEFSLLYLLFPIFTWIARTVYPGFLVLTFFLASVYFYLSDKKISWAISGLMAGLAILVRYDVILAIAAFVAGAFFSNRKKLPYFMAPLLVIGLFVGLLNILFYGSPFSVGSHTAFGLLSSILSLDPIDILVFAAVFIFLYPLLLLSPLLEKRTGMRNEFIGLSIAYLIFNATFTRFFAFDLSLDTLFITRHRYLIPMLGVLLIPYSSFLDSLVDRFSVLKKNFRLIVYSLVIVALAGTIFISGIHQDFLVNYRQGVLDEVYSNTETGSLIIGSSDDCIYFMKGLLPERKYLSITPGSDLAGNPENISIAEKLENFGENSYLMILDYSYLSDRTARRRDTILNERQKIIDFYEKNESSFDFVFEDKQKGLAIYRYNSGELSD